MKSSRKSTKTNEIKPKIDSKNEIKVLKKTDIKSVREELTPPDGVCPLLKCKLTNNPATKAALDHDHISGKVRGVLSMNANTFLGRIEKGFSKWCNKHTDLELIEFLENVVNYLKQDLQPYEHPEHRDKEKRRIRRWKDSTLITKIKAAGGEVPEGCKRRALVNLYLEYCVFKEK